MQVMTMRHSWLWMGSYSICSTLINTMMISPSLIIFKTCPHLIIRQWIKIACSNMFSPWLTCKLSVILEANLCTILGNPNKNQISLLIKKHSLSIPRCCPSNSINNLWNKSKVSKSNSNNLQLSSLIHCLKTSLDSNNNSLYYRTSKSNPNQPNKWKASTIYKTLPTLEVIVWDLTN